MPRPLAATPLFFALALALVGCSDDDPRPHDAGAADAGFSDGSSPIEVGLDVDGALPDAGAADVFSTDLGPADAHGVDGGPGSGAGVRVFPEPILFPAGRGSLASVTVRNEGPGAASIRSVAVLAPDGAADAVDFVFEACGGPRCVEDIRLCDPTAEPGCTPTAAVFDLRYTNPDRSRDDDGILRIEIDNREPLDAVVFATDAPCPFPTARPALQRPAEDLRVGDTVVVDGSGSDPGGEVGLSFFFWAFADSPGPIVPDLTGQGGPLVTFTATAAGTHEVELTVTNGCGQTSPAPGRLRFDVE